MIRYYEEDYGRYFYELEKSDESEIVEKVKEAIKEMHENGEIEDDETPVTVTITMVCPIDNEEIDFNIDVKDFL